MAGKINAPILTLLVPAIKEISPIAAMMVKIMASIFSFFIVSPASTNSDLAICCSAWDKLIQRQGLWIFCPKARTFCYKRIYFVNLRFINLGLIYRIYTRRTRSTRAIPISLINPTSEDMVNKAIRI